jgi:hypothetical protein
VTPPPEMTASYIAFMSESERAKFDKWAEMYPLVGHPGALLAAFRDLQWQGWQARAALHAKPEAPPVPAVTKGKPAG